MDVSEYRPVDLSAAWIEDEIEARLAVGEDANVHCDSSASDASLFPRNILMRLSLATFVFPSR